MCFTNEAITPFLQQSRALFKNTFSQISSFESPSHSEGPSPTPGVQAVYRDRDCCPQGLQKNRGKRGKNCNKRKLNWCGGSRSMPAPSWLLTRPCPILCFLQESHLGYPLSSPYSITSQKETASIILWYRSVRIGWALTKRVYSMSVHTEGNYGLVLRAGQSARETCRNISLIKRVYLKLGEFLKS